MLLSPQRLNRSDAFLGRLFQPEVKVLPHFGEVTQVFFSYGLCDHICLTRSDSVFASPTSSASRLIEEYYINGEMASGLRSSEVEAEHGAEGTASGLLDSPAAVQHTRLHGNPPLAKRIRDSALDIAATLSHNL